MRVSRGAEREVRGVIRGGGGGGGTAAADVGKIKCR